MHSWLPISINLGIKRKTVRRLVKKKIVALGPTTLRLPRSSLIAGHRIVLEGKCTTIKLNALSAGPAFEKVCCYLDHNHTSQIGCHGRTGLEWRQNHSDV